MSKANIIVVALAVGRPSLAGIGAGKAALASLLPAVPPGSGPLYLDFDGVDLITSSAFREAILPVVTLANGAGRPCILVNVNTTTKEEACIAAERMEVVLVFGDLTKKKLQNPIAIGQLEEKQVLTLRIVMELGEADAKDVKERSGESTVTTVWNNRLVALHKLGLLRERKVGKTKLYSPIVEGLSYGTGFHP